MGRLREGEAVLVDLPGGLITNHSHNYTSELAYGILTDDALFAVNSGDQFLSKVGKIRNLFVSPNAAERDFFYCLLWAMIRN